MPHFRPQSLPFLRYIVVAYLSRRGDGGPFSEGILLLDVRFIFLAASQYLVSPLDPKWEKYNAINNELRREFELCHVLKDRLTAGRSGERTEASRTTVSRHILRKQLVCDSHVSFFCLLRDCFPFNHRNEAASWLVTERSRWRSRRCSCVCRDISNFCLSKPAF